MNLEIDLYYGLFISLTFAISFNALQRVKRIFNIKIIKNV